MPLVEDPAAGQLAARAGYTGQTDAISAVGSSMGP